MNRKLKKKEQNWREKQNRKKETWRRKGKVLDAQREREEWEGKHNVSFNPFIALIL